MFVSKGKPLKCMGVTLRSNVRALSTGVYSSCLTVKDNTSYNTPMASDTNFRPPVAGQVFLEFKSATIY